MPYRLSACSDGGYCVTHRVIPIADGLDPQTAKSRYPRTAARAASRRDVPGPFGRIFDSKARLGAHRRMSLKTLGPYPLLARHHEVALN
jgi:hypothetical protein